MEVHFLTVAGENVWSHSFHRETAMATVVEELCYNSAFQEGLVNLVHKGKLLPCSTKASLGQCIDEDVSEITCITLESPGETAAVRCVVYSMGMAAALTWNGFTSFRYVENVGDRAGTRELSQMFQAKCR